MPDVSFGPTPRTANSEGSQSGGSCQETVCIDANRIYDSCGSKDCLSDLNVYFTEADAAVVGEASSVRICRASVITANTEVEPVAFHRGFYSVDVTFFFNVTLEVYTSKSAIPQTLEGLAVYGKRAVLYGSEGNAKLFSSDGSAQDEGQSTGCAYRGSLPVASVQISEPMALSAKLTDRPARRLPSAEIPDSVISFLGGAPVVSQGQGALATVGIFTITQLERRVQLVIPSYDFYIPKKECAPQSDDPCEVFGKVEFPSEAFFPPSAEEEEKERCSFECSCG